MPDSATGTGGGLSATDTLLLKLFPAGEFSGAAYYLSCALLFTICGMIVGYFIWRKGHMQTLDAESEIRRTEHELNLLRDDLSSEERLLQHSGRADS
ncbi:MAG: hypothetical protein ABL994_22210 [Verrucomicrobiales bacterium]